MPAANSTLAIGGVSSPLDSFVVAESSVLRINFCAESLAVKYNPILQIQFILNLDDTFALNTISLLIPPNRSVRVWFKHGSNLSENLCP